MTIKKQFFRSLVFAILNEVTPGRDEVNAEGTPSEESRNGMLFRSS